MRIIVRLILCISALLVVAPSREAPDAPARACVHATAVSASVVGISRHLPDEMGVYEPQGSGFALSPTEFMLVEHAARGLRLTHLWQEVELFQDRPDGRRAERATVRIRQIFNTGLPREDGLVMIELRHPPVMSLKILPVRATPLQHGEVATGVAYPGGSLAVVRGAFIAHTWRLGAYRPDHPAFLGFELLAGESRRAIFTGASGGPIVDCNGAVAGVISNAYGDLPRTVDATLASIPGFPARRGEANVWAVPTYPVAQHLHQHEHLSAR